MSILCIYTESEKRFFYFVLGIARVCEIIYLCTRKIVHSA